MLTPLKAHLVKNIKILKLLWVACVSFPCSYRLW